MRLSAVVSRVLPVSFRQDMRTTGDSLRLTHYALMTNSVTRPAVAVAKVNRVGGHAHYA